jgi:hypothetical protein
MPVPRGEADEPGDHEAGTGEAAAEASTRMAGEADEATQAGEAGGDAAWSPTHGLPMEVEAMVEAPQAQSLIDSSNPL